MFVTDAITAVLLFAQFSILRSRALLAISTGYLFTALIVIPWTLTFPGVYTPGGLLGFGLQQSTHWLYISWHAGFPMFVVEYANQRGEPQWSAPPNSTWDYTIFGRERPLPPPDERLELLFEKVPGGRGGYNRWTLNGKSWPNTNPLLTTERGKRYRLVMTNKSGDNHPVHLHRHTFEVTKIGDKPTAGVMKDTINMTRFSTVEIDFIADDPGPSLLHCHHQDHQDEGFMGLVTYL
jgi:hypothetical protein